jgi:hypothetical protein
MKRKLSERNIVIVLFVMVLVTFSLAQEDSRKMGKDYSGIKEPVKHWFVQQPEINKQTEPVQ